VTHQIKVFNVKIVQAGLTLGPCHLDLESSLMSFSFPIYLWVRDTISWLLGEHNRVNYTKLKHCV
jgi:hypothetical protein